MKAHDPYIQEGRDALVKTIAWERKRHGGMVRAGVAERVLTALRDVHASPALRNQEAWAIFNRIAVDIANGHVAGVAVEALTLVELARKQDRALRRRRPRRFAF